MSNRPPPAPGHSPLSNTSGAVLRVNGDPSGTLGPQAETTATQSQSGTSPGRWSVRRLFRSVQGPSHTQQAHENLPVRARVKFGPGARPQEVEPGGLVGHPPLSLSFLFVPVLLSSLP